MIFSSVEGFVHVPPSANYFRTDTPPGGPLGAGLKKYTETHYSTLTNFTDGTHVFACRSTKK